jgi:hypothetical protein
MPLYEESTATTQYTQYTTDPALGRFFPTIVELVMGTNSGHIRFRGRK